ncbi:MAG: hypothetical protein EOP49_50245, partial [Sphingobacteriales bacterium]
MRQSLLGIPVLVLIFSLAGCKKTSDELVGETSSVQGSSVYVSNTDSTAILKIKFSILGEANDYGLLDGRLFSFNQSALFTTSTNSYGYCNVTQLQKSRRTPQPLSYYLLIDKSTPAITSDITRGLLTPFKEGFFQQFRSTSDQGVELAIGTCAAGNTRLPSFQTIAPGFVQDPDEFSTSAIAPVFDVSYNEGAPNLMVGIDSALSYLIQNGRNSKRVLFIVTDFKSGTNDYTTLYRITNRARANGVTVCIYCLTAPDFFPYTFRHLINGTDGLTFHNITGDYLGNATYGNLRAVFRILSGQMDMYEAQLDLKGPTNTYFRNGPVVNLDIRGRVFNNDRLVFN